MKRCARKGNSGGIVRCAAVIRAVLIKVYYLKRNARSYSAQQARRNNTQDIIIKYPMAIFVDFVCLFSGEALQ